MPKTYSTYEAKARLSELLDTVRKGQVVTITSRGVPVAEVHPVRTEQASLEDRLADLHRRGIIAGAAERRSMKPLVRKRGALKRFLEERE